MEELMIMNWIRSLFTNHKEEVKVPHKVEPRGRYMKLDATTRNNLVTDRLINQMKYKDISSKYGVAKTTAHYIVQRALERRGLQ